MDAGASGYVLKKAAREELILVIRVVAAGGIFLDPVMARKVLGSPEVSSAADAQDLRSSSLSKRERAVLKGVAKGYSNKEIAHLSRLLSLSVRYPCLYGPT
ncbi:MAG TPA: LuxR C-terminal-related transcriptional regulator [Herpetosiphonaceae bacterium]|nr:LuxR C-terminal-related transcriptional regulator [Herpetosiphonaceae bacterium]